MSEDKCPFCGAVWNVSKESFLCGFTGDYKKRPPECYVRQITALQTEKARLKERLELWRTYYMAAQSFVIAYGIHNGQVPFCNLCDGYGEHEISCPYRTLKAAGEID